MDAQAKQQVVERVKQATNILVTVSRDPSVDQLAACIGLTLMLNKLGKHATAVFSGQVPSTIEFLQPEKTIETNTDSLRDFIISLDKSKADKLRYKVEDQFVRIFITPYRTSLTEKDLQFSQGDFNVDVVIALGVLEQAQLDEAITAHGKILHDAVVISLSSGQSKAANLGQINWQDAAASSLSEMVVSISEAFGANLIDPQMATAFLTGIVSETDRFSNKKTSPKVMTMSAQLMAAGANQQLIVSKLEPPPPKVPEAPPKPAEPPKPEPTKQEKKPETKPEGVLSVDHLGSNQSPEVAIPASEIRIDQEGNLKKAKDLSMPEPVKTPEPLSSPKPEQTKSEPSEAAEPAAQTPAAVEEPDAPMPGGHVMMSSAPLMESPFSAGGNEDVATGSTNPSNGSGFITHAPDLLPPAEQARSAVEQAFQSASPNPAADAIKKADEVVQQPPPPAPTEDKTNEMPPAPPFPPPLTPAQGVVIPPPPYNSSLNNKNTEDTL